MTTRKPRAKKPARPKTAPAKSSGRHPGGRPTKYDPAFCEQIIDLMGRGFSIGAVAGELGVARSTAELWQHEHPEFSDAVKVGRARAQLFWEKQLMRVAQVGGGPGTATAVIFGLKNRSPDDWRDKHEIEHSGVLSAEDRAAKEEYVRSMGAMLEEKFRDLKSLEGK